MTSTCDLTADQLRQAMAPRSDQLNADDMIAGPVTARIVRIKPGNREGVPCVELHLHGYNGRPWRPCKTEQRVLSAAWGDEPAMWVGRVVRLKRDSTVRFGGEAVGGIRIDALSHLRGPVEVSSQVTRGKRGLRRVEPLAVPFAHELQDLVQRGVCTREQAQAALGGRKAADVPASEHAAILASLQPAPDVDAAGGEE